MVQSRADVLHIITGLEDGGAEGVLYRLLKERNHLRDNVISLTSVGKYGPLLEGLGFTVFALNMPRGKVTWAGLKTLYQTVKQINPDVIQTWLYHADFLGGLVGFSAGSRDIFWGVRHSTFSKEQRLSSAYTLARVSAFLSRFIPRAIICAGESALQVHQTIGYERSKLIAIPNGYDLNQFAPSKSLRQNFRAEFEIGDDALVLGLVARFNTQKDHPTLLEALSIFKQTCEKQFLVVFVGEDMNEQNEELRQMIVNSSLSPDNILLVGQRTDIPAVMNGLDLHVTSSAFGEAFPNVIAEAMACGTPCVSTDVGDSATIIGDTGWVVEPRAAQCLANALHAAVAEKETNPVAWAGRQTRARNRILNEFTIEAMVAHYEAVWSGQTKRNP